MADPSTGVPIGARRRRFVLERPLEEPDGFGGVVRRYVAGPLLWGAIEPLRPVARTRFGRAEAVATHRIRFRFGPEITPAMRLASGPRRFAIQSAGDPDGRRREVVCQVEELVGEAGAA
ncbi:head-tail adaptor protein [Methylobacterium sp. Leaf113]|uniref:head-tail adaptor protein n=1 Tax=Methylobacterium sp. Leaf113 TaxID=1736259 RepID=UPI0006F3D3CF|nr:head-tail adaptor protein [Methylobacterium sp. Leaf113]KQP94701.1 head-tail adaptor protein [Methylobacterium sp. Leaf113]